MTAAETSRLTDHDLYLFREGTHRRLYERMGCQLGAEAGHFSVWAPNARRVAVIGDFNGWRDDAHPLAPRPDSSGVWETVVPRVQRGHRYKYRIESRYGDHRVDKADPFAFYAETPPGTASRAWTLEYEWGDGEWMARRPARNALSAADLDLRGPPRIVAPHARRRVPQLPRRRRSRSPDTCPRSGSRTSSCCR